MDAVDKKVETKCGLSVYDLADCYFRDWYEDGRTPASAASAAIRAEQEG